MIDQYDHFPYKADFNVEEWKAELIINCIDIHFVLRHSIKTNEERNIRRDDIHMLQEELIVADLDSNRHGSPCRLIIKTKPGLVSTFIWHKRNSNK